MNKVSHFIVHLRGRNQTGNMKRQCEFLILLAAFAVAFSAVTATKGIKRGKNKDMSRLTLGERQILSQLNMDLALTECLSEF